MSPSEPAQRPHRHSDAALCAIVVGACLMLTRPFVEMGIVDDWSYVKTAQVFAATGHVVYNGWGAVMLGWQIPVSALCIKLLWFSFTAARAFMLPVTMIGAYLFSLVLAGFGLSRRMTAFGTLCLYLSPVCLPMEFTLMTDIEGLMVVILCIYLCQQAVRAQGAGATIAWLAVASATNVVGGSVRQIAWLGALIMVPSTALLLRRRRGVVIAEVAFGLASVATIVVMLHWFNRQPYTVPEHPFATNINVLAIAHLGAQLIRALLCLAFLVLPITAGALAWVRRAQRGALLRTIAVCILALLIFSTLPFLGKHHRPLTWLVPSTLHVLDSLGMTQPTLFEMLGQRVAFPAWLRVLLTTLSVTAAWATVEFLRTCPWRSTEAPSSDSEPRLDAPGTLAWIFFPFLLFNWLLLVPRGLAGMLMDRYLMEIMVVAIILLLWAAQRAMLTAGRPLRMPDLSAAMLAMFSLFAIAGTHDFYALYRARVLAANEVTQSGLPPTAVQGGFDYDGWTQIEAAGVVQNDHTRVHVIQLPEDCGDWFSGSSPAVNPRYFVLRSPVGCYEPSSFPDVTYETWLPPYHRRLMVEQLLPQYRNQPYVTMR